MPPLNKTFFTSRKHGKNNENAKFDRFLAFIMLNTFFCAEFCPTPHQNRASPWFGVLTLKKQWVQISLTLTRDVKYIKLAQNNPAEGGDMPGPFSFSLLRWCAFACFCHVIFRHENIASCQDLLSTYR